MSRTKHRGADLRVPGIIFVSGECECPDCKGWAWSRHLIGGTRIEPCWPVGCVIGGDSVEDAAYDYNLTREQMLAALEWSRRRGRKLPPHAIAALESRSAPKRSRLG